MKSLQRLAGLTAVAGMLLSPGLAHAIPMLVTDRAALGGTDTFDWGTLGPLGTEVPFDVSYPAVGGSVEAMVDLGSGFPTIQQQGLDWAGNFAPGDNLLSTGSISVHCPAGCATGLTATGGDAPLDIRFDTPVAGARAQIQSNAYGDFVAQLAVYDLSNTLLGSFYVGGTSNANADNSAVFLGVWDTSASIARIEYSVALGADPIPDPGFFGAQFAINSLDVVTAPVPEPATLLLVGSGLAGLAGWRRRRR